MGKYYKNVWNSSHLSVAVKSCTTLHFSEELNICLINTPVTYEKHHSLSQCVLLVTLTYIYPQTHPQCFEINVITHTY